MMSEEKTSTSLHPNALFHFTNADGLRGILKRLAFQLSYARETVQGPTSAKCIAVPMVSFCDLRLSELSSHMEKYGRYGIGLNKTWAKNRGLSPVAYINSESELALSIIDGAAQAMDIVALHPNNEESQIAENVDMYFNVMNTQRFIKNYEGRLIRRGVDVGVYRFADEKEWRYVLPLNVTKGGGVWPYEDIRDSDEPFNKEEHNSKIKDNPLNFCADDVKYIIVETEEEISYFQQAIEKMNISPYDKRRLTTRIFSAALIAEDF